MAKKRILIGKPGLDGHDRGARYVVRLLREAGYEVIYTGIRRSAEEIVNTAIREHVDAIGLSSLSGAHRVHFKRVVDLLKERGAQSIPVFGGGIVPEDDVRYLNSIGVRQIMQPGTSAATILSVVARLLSEPPKIEGTPGVACRCGPRARQMAIQSSQPEVILQ